MTEQQIGSLSKSIAYYNVSPVYYDYRTPAVVYTSELTLTNVGDRTPCVWINNGGPAYGVPAGWLSLHPGPGTEPSVLRWTAPIAGNIHVTGQFLTGDGGIMKVAVRHKNEMIWTATDSGSFDLDTKVATGETIDFVVYGGYGFGNTPISATIVYGN